MAAPNPLPPTWLATFSLCSLASPARWEAAVPQGHARLHSADADLFVEAPDVQGMLLAYGETALARFFDDPAVSTRLGALFGREQFGWRDLLALPAQALDEESPSHARALRALATMSSASFSISGLSAGGPSLVDELATVALNERALDATRSALLGAYFAAGEYPETLAGVTLEDGSLPLDAWGRDFRYSLREDGSGYELATLGADGEPGGSGVNADLVGAEQDVAAVVQIFAAHIGLQIVVELPDEATSRGAFDDLFPAEMDPILARDGEVVRLRPPGFDARTWCARRGALLAFGFGTCTPEGFDALAAGSAVGAADRHARFQRELPAQGQPVLRGYHDVAWRTIGESIARHLEDDFELDLPQLANLGEELESGLPSGGFVTTLARGRFLTESSETADGGSDAYGVPGVPIDRAVLELVPSDAIFAWASNLDAAGACDDALESMTAMLGEEAAAWRSTAESTRLRTQLFANLGDTLVVYSGPWKRLGLPRVYGVMSLADPAAVDTALRDLPSLLPPGLAETIGYKARDYKGTTYYSLNLAAFTPTFAPQDSEGRALPMGGPFGGSTPGLCVLDGRLVTALSAGDLKDLIKESSKQDAPPPAGAGPLDALLAEHPEAVSCLMIDWGGILRDVYAMGRNMATMIVGKSELESQLARFPDPEILIALARPTTSYTVPMDAAGGGGGLLTHSESSFGPEVFPVAILTGLAFALSHSDLEATSAEDDDAPARTEATLDELRVALKVYRAATGRFPGALEELVAPQPDYPDGFLGAREVPRDGWEQEFSYALGADGASCRVWSAGANGRFEDGVGDDLVLEVDATVARR
jgi:hypothetical protein